MNVLIALHCIDFKLNYIVEFYQVKTSYKNMEDFKNMETFLFDCDGVLWSGSHLLPHVQETIHYLRSQGKQILFVTNNSTHSRASYMKKFQSFGLQVDKNEIFGSAYAAACFIQQSYSSLLKQNHQSVYVIGMQGILDELQDLDIPYMVDSNQDRFTELSQISEIVPDESIGAVLFGFDIELHYKKLAIAFSSLYNRPQIPFIATNDDSTLPSSNRLYPGTGALLSVLKVSCQRDPIVIGKPHQTMLDVIIKKFALDPSKTIMIGDRLDTDIAFGLFLPLHILLIHYHPCRY